MMIGPGSSVRARDTFEERRDLLVRRFDPARLENDNYGDLALTNLWRGVELAASNRKLAELTDWFGERNAARRDPRGECDFVAMTLIRAWYLAGPQEALTTETRVAVKSFFLRHNFESRYGSENHALLFRTSRYLAAQAWPAEVFQQFGDTGAGLREKDSEWLKAFLAHRGRYGWAEFSSAHYIFEQVRCLLALHDCAEDQALRTLASNLLNYTLLDLGLSSIEGMYGGAHGRIYDLQALDHSREASAAIGFLFLDTHALERFAPGRPMAEAYMTSFRAAPLVATSAGRRVTPYEVRQRFHLHNTSDTLPQRPASGSIRKYTYYHPRFILGAVQLQDPAPTDWPPYAYHQQHNWDLTFAGDSRARLFTHHPGRAGKEHGEWTGDFECGCGRFFQHKTAVIGRYEIPPDQPCQWIHAYVPRDAFDEVIEHAGWIFVRKDAAFGALKMLGGNLVWHDSGTSAPRELVSRAAPNAFVCEAGSAEEFGSFKAFVEEILGNLIEWEPATGAVSYVSRRAGRLALTADGVRRLDGISADLEYPLFCAPGVYGAWGVGDLEIQREGQILRLEFP